MTPERPRTDVRWRALLLLAVAVTAAVSAILGYRLGFNDAQREHAAVIEALASRGN